MTLLSDHLLAKSNARAVLLRTMHEMHEVMASDLHIVAKHSLIHGAHRESVANRIWLIRPEKPWIDDVLTGATSEVKEERVAEYISKLEELLNYREELAKFRALEDQLKEILSLPIVLSEKRAQMVSLLPQIEAAIKATGLGFGDPRYISSVYCTGDDLVKYVGRVSEAIARG